VRVLLLNLYYPPDTSATAKMAQTVVAALAEKHDVTVLSGRPSYDPTERRPWRFFQSAMFFWPYRARSFFPATSSSP
jgi:hypothetical protein